MPAADDALRVLLAAAGAGRLPPPDGTVRVMPAPQGHLDAVLGFTAHHIVAAAVDETWVRAHLHPDDLAGPMRAHFLAALGDELGAEPGSLDVVLAAIGEGGAVDALQEVLDADHPRVERARRWRDEVRVFVTADGAGVLTLGRGLAGRLEGAFEVEPGRRGAGLGRRLAAAARTLAPSGEPVFMQTAPGNAASLRAILAAGFRPIGSEVLLLRRGSERGD
jgi:GNAT superfamily N-acetyltransferase